MATDNSIAPSYRLSAGPQDDNNGTVTFGFYAPGKREVYLIGSFNDWNLRADPLVEQPGGLWRIEKPLAPGRHEYQFCVDDDLIVCDPYARELGTRRGTETPTAVIEVGAASYPWQHDGWPRPTRDDLVIYEVHIGDFSPEGNFRGLLDRLDLIKELGVNAIELMPVMEFAGGESAWGYEPLHFFAIHPSYGSAAEFKALVDGAHSRGIAIILDIVLAHTAHAHTFNRLYRYEDSPWYGPSLGETNQFGFPALDHGKPAVAAYVKDVLTYWLAEFHVDGFRFDYCLGIGARLDMGMPYLVAVCRTLDPNAYLIAEYLPEEQGVLRCCTFDGAWHGRFKSAIHALLRETDYRDFSIYRFREALVSFDPRDDGYTDVTAPVNYLESHDEERLLCVLSREAGFEPEVVEAKGRLAATLLLTLPGIPMLYQGQEWGEETDKQVNARNTLRWIERETPRGRRLFDHYCTLLTARRQQPALRGSDIAFLAVERDKRLVAYHRRHAGEDGTANHVVVAANFTPVVQGLTIPFPAAGRWRDRLTGDELAVEEQREVTLPAYGAAVYEYES